ncbi:MAG: bifunctional diaminohydroxyphosphoribosylaminopyrimidine deaminase/5-amino-6-(5-phosphoribosylamino)uracil reductase RibD [Desulfohalobiaceae bacterium]|nr:bifunctional diaminohydroxyphosphoribosylaminopyrimidine deaminase/5-amino-6-(5-phosphoribosylamino)uracil reductase RibD [Desulfohalobiaceae bacterium]
MSSRDLMHRAASLARKGRGNTAPNPCVGAVLVKNGEVIGQGWHEARGRPHAEVMALESAREAGRDPRGASLFVTLEPCNHHGATPPCTRAILDAGIERVYVGTADPNPRARGGGAQFLRESGVLVETGIAEQACRDLIRDFECWHVQERPHVRLKLAATLDGRIATRSGDSAWVSSREARQEVHRLRQGSQAVLVGGNTLYEDDPQLTPRGGGQEQTSQGKLAVVATSRLPDPEDGLFLLRNRPGETIIWTTPGQAEGNAAERLRSLGVGVWPLEGLSGCGFDLASGLRRLYREHACYYLLCEGGGHLALSLCQQGLADEIVYFLAPRILGDEQGRSAFAGRSVEEMQQALSYRIVDYRGIGRDLKITLLPSPEEDNRQQSGNPSRGE